MTTIHDIMQAGVGVPDREKFENFARDLPGIPVSRGVLRCCDRLAGLVNFSLCVYLPLFAPGAMGSAVTTDKTTRRGCNHSSSDQCSHDCCHHGPE
jgi:hypothetical protein